MSHLSEEDLILLFYREPGTEEAGAHLNECAECRTALDALAATLSSYDEWAPEPPSELSRNVWARLAPEIADRDLHRGWRILINVAACAIVLIAVFFAGRYTGKPEEPAMTGLSDQAREKILAIAVADHLDRVQILFTELANTKTTNSSELTREQERAADLLGEDRLLQQSLQGHGGNTTGEFLEDVERFLIEAEHADADEREGLRRHLESGSLLFKVRIIESNLRNRGQEL